jgi:8-oxo-dGTP pyrophosphatase MutT (NUDIX family)
MPVGVPEMTCVDAALMLRDIARGVPTATLPFAGRDRHGDPVGRWPVAASAPAGYEGAVLLESTRRDLDHYQPVDERELGFRQRLLALLDLPAPFARNQYEPGHLTASAFVLSPERDQVLLIFHRKLGIWIQPGGHIEPSDTSLRGAALREVREEVGLDLSEALEAAVFDLDIHGIPARKLEPFHEHFDVRFCFQAPSLNFSASPEVVDARWVELSKIDQVTSDESVLRAARKLRV